MVTRILSPRMREGKSQDPPAGAGFTVSRRFLPCTWGDNLMMFSKLPPDLFCPSLAFLFLEKS